jgi:hypothetical protein
MLNEILWFPTDKCLIKGKCVSHTNKKYIKVHNPSNGQFLTKISDRKKFLSTTHFGHFSTLKDIGSAAAFLCSEKLSIIIRVALEFEVEDVYDYKRRLR